MFCERSPEEKGNSRRAHQVPGEGGTRRLPTVRMKTLAVMRKSCRPQTLHITNRHVVQEVPAARGCMTNRHVMQGSPAANGTFSYTIIWCRKQSTAGRAHSATSCSALHVICSLEGVKYEKITGSTGNTGESRRRPLPKASLREGTQRHRVLFPSDYIRPGKSWRAYMHALSSLAGTGSMPDERAYPEEGLPFIWHSTGTFMRAAGLCGCVRFLDFGQGAAPCAFRILQ
jgi:hypothetical protein